MTTVDTKHAPRRALHFSSLEEIRAELDRLAAAGASGVQTTGNWTPGQVFWHVGSLVDLSVDGFPGKAPAIVRFFMKLLFRRKALRTDDPMPAGFKLPKQASFLIPPDDVSFDDGVAVFRRALDRVADGEQMLQDSPVLGPMRHEDWITVHRKHAAMHLSFVDVE